MKFSHIPRPWWRYPRGSYDPFRPSTWDAPRAERVKNYLRGHAAHYWQLRVIGSVWTGLAAVYIMWRGLEWWPAVVVFIAGHFAGQCSTGGRWSMQRVHDTEEELAKLQAEEKRA